MKKDELIIQALGRAAATTAYVALVALFMSNASLVLGPKDTFLTPVFVLLTFVVSAAITGFLVLGKPVELYLAGAKKEAFTFLTAVIGWLVAFLFLVGLMMRLFR